MVHHAGVYDFKRCFFFLMNPHNAFCFCVGVPSGKMCGSWISVLRCAGYCFSLGCVCCWSCCCVLRTVIQLLTCDLTICVLNCCMTKRILNMDSSQGDLDAVDRDVKFQALTNMYSLGVKKTEVTTTITNEMFSLVTVTAIFKVFPLILQLLFSVYYLLHVC